MDYTRREVVRGLTLAGTAGMLGIRPGTASAEPPNETTKLRVGYIVGTICTVPQFLVEELLLADGFTEVQYIKFRSTPERVSAIASGEVDFSMNFVAPLIIRIDAGDPVVVLSGVHVGCLALFGGERVRTLRDLKGKTVAVPALGSGSSHYVFIASMVAYVGMAPRKDINFVVHPVEKAMELLGEKKVDAVMVHMPEPELRAKKMWHEVVNTTTDRPWSQHFCCTIAGNREFVRKHPVATKRALRAILKGADVCAVAPERAARLLLDKGYTSRYEETLHMLKELPYNKWREYDHEATVRFYALRLHEAGLIKSTPQKIIAQGTDWRFLNELKKELKG